MQLTRYEPSARIYTTDRGQLLAVRISDFAGSLQMCVKSNRAILLHAWLSFPVPPAPIEKLDPEINDELSYGKHSDTSAAGGLNGVEQRRTWLNSRGLHSLYHFLSSLFL